VVDERVAVFVEGTDEVVDLEGVSDTARGRGCVR
jgi:hypothetical protein